MAAYIKLAAELQTGLAVVIKISTDDVPHSGAYVSIINKNQDNEVLASVRLDRSQLDMLVNTLKRFL